MNRRYNDFERRFFSGEHLFGDDFSAEQITTWYEEEEYAYWRIRQVRKHSYLYHSLNHFHGFRFLRGQTFDCCLAIGCANGDDVSPIAAQVRQFIALEPAEQFWTTHINGTPSMFIKPSISAEIPLEPHTVDLVVCLGVLHHIANVSFVLGEISRVLCPGGYFVLREPVSTMGDWRKPRGRLTPNERGLPPTWLQRTLLEKGFLVLRRVFCGFSPLVRVCRWLRVPAYDSPLIVRLDAVLSQCFRWNLHYHRDKLFKKIAPGSVFYVLRKRSTKDG